MTRVNIPHLLLLSILDTYCCLEMDSYGHFYKKAQTRTCFNMSDPSWDEDFELDLDGSQTLRILCYRREPGEENDVVIGKCALEVSFTIFGPPQANRCLLTHCSQETPKRVISK